MPTVPVADTVLGPADRRPIGRQLAREWAAMRHRPELVERAEGWRIVHGSIHDLDRVLAACGSGDHTRGDGTLRRLVLRAADDPLAARVALQRILPALAALARRRGRGALDELVAAAWIAIVTFDPARRPGSLAAALVADADHQAFRRRWRRAAHREVVTADGFDRTESTDRPHPNDELRELLELAAGDLDRSDLALVRRLLAGESTEHIAAVVGVTARTIRNRRSRVTDRLRDLALAA